MRLSIVQCTSIPTDHKTRYPELQASTSTGPNAQSLASLLSVSLSHLDSEAEMRKFFGSKVVQANKSGPSGAPGSSSRRPATVQRSNLTRPQPTWWPASQREGLSIRPLTDEELKLKGEGRSDEKWWTVDYSKRYKSATKAFIRSVMAGGMQNASMLLMCSLKSLSDPEAFWEILRKLPWHADTLLQLSEVYRHREGGPILVSLFQDSPNGVAFKSMLKLLILLIVRSLRMSELLSERSTSRVARTASILTVQKTGLSSLLSIGKSRMSTLSWKFGN